MTWASTCQKTNKQEEEDLFKLISFVHAMHVPQNPPHFFTASLKFQNFDICACNTKIFHWEEKKIESGQRSCLKFRCQNLRRKIPANHLDCILKNKLWSPLSLYERTSYWRFYILKKSDFKRFWWEIFFYSKHDVYLEFYYEWMNDCL